MSGSSAKASVVSAASTAVVALVGPVLVMIAFQHSVPVFGIMVAYLVLFAAFLAATRLESRRSSRLSDLQELAPRSLVRERSLHR